MPDATELGPVARHLYQLTEPIHAVVYFSPEPIAAMKAAGYRGYWMGYFAQRSAPLGEVSPELVHSIFYNFSWERVTGALPDAWTFAPPEIALQSRRESTAVTLRRLFGDLTEAPAFGEAVELLEKAAFAASLEGHPLYAANRALEVPTDPVERLWHATTLLREHRGDGHIAALMTAGITGRQSHVLHALTTGNPRDVYQLARDLGDDEWSALAGELQVRGVVDEDGQVTPEGRDLKAGIEDMTDELAAASYAVLTEKEQRALADALLPLVLTVVHSGEIPINSPMGLNLAEIG
ncbi:MAG: SCO6745 family protein [Marmoricola sp.]